MIYDGITNFWSLFWETPWFIKLLCPFMFLGAFQGGLKDG